MLEDIGIAVLRNEQPAGIGFGAVCAVGIESRETEVAGERRTLFAEFGAQGVEDRRIIRRIGHGLVDILRVGFVRVLIGGVIKEEVSTAYIHVLVFRSVIKVQVQLARVIFQHIGIDLLSLKVVDDE